MVEEWIGCPYCFLGFSDDAEYGRHREREHKGRKYRTPSLLRVE